MTDKERRAHASNWSKAIVDQLRESNERAAEHGAPKVKEKEYANLQRVMTRKLRQRLMT